MDLDAILGLLFFVFFVVLPLFSRAGKRGGQGKKQAGTGQQQGTGTGQQQTTGRSPAAGGQPTQAGTAQEQRQVTLAEVRRRVEEAQRSEEERARLRREGRSQSGARGQATQAGRPRSLVSSDPFEGSLLSEPERRLSELGTPVDAGGLGPEGSTTGRSLIGREGAPPQAGGRGRSPLGREGTPAQAGGSARSIIGREGTSHGGDMGGRLIIPQEGSGQGAFGTEVFIGREGVRAQQRAGGRKGAASRPMTPGGLGREGAPVVAKGRAARRSAASAAEIGADAYARNSTRPYALEPRARLGRAEAVQTDRDSILRGLIWHEVLSPPLALRTRRER